MVSENTFTPVHNWVYPTPALEYSTVPGIYTACECECGARQVADVGKVRGRMKTVRIYQDPTRPAFDLLCCPVTGRDRRVNVGRLD
jgi:hypothetical protein